MVSTKQDFIKKYTRALWEGNAALFAGAGLSQPSGFVNWKEFIRPLATEIGLDVDQEHDYLSVAQYYRNRKGASVSVSQAIMDAFSKNAATNDNIKILSRLPIFAYWTTNYDELLEKGIKEANRNPDVKYESDQLTVIKPGRDAIVYKMHGDVSNPAKAVLTKSDYELYAKERPLFRTTLKSNLISKVFLFIGFSFEDPNIDYIFGQLHTLLADNVKEHFCFFRRVQESECANKKEYEYCLAKQDMREENLRKYGIQTIYVDSYNEITHILLELEKAFKMHNVFISGSADEFVAPWDRVKTEKLAGQLAATLVRNEYCVTSGFGLGIGSAVINGALDVIYKEKFSHVDKYLCLRPFPQNIVDPNERIARWKKYREDILGHTGVSIFMFGNKKDTTGNIIEADGCVQEFEIAKEKGNLIIPIGSTGYAAKTILGRVRADIADYQYLLPYLDRLENEKNIDKIVELIIEIINTRG